MRNLFVKILLWFILTVIVAVSGTFYVSNVLAQRQQAQQQGNRGPRFFRFELQEARDSWLNSGKDGLATVLKRVKDADGYETHLADASQHDLLTGDDWSKEIAASQSGGGRGPGRGSGRGDNPFFLFTHVDNPPPQFFITQSKSTPKYYFIVKNIPNPNQQQAGGRIELLPETWWMLGIFAILCYVLARHVTSPLRTMQKTVERFGKGDFTARVNSKRSDELGQLGRTVDRMAERIDDLMKSQRRLLQDISHELRSPLARLGVAVELARGGADLDS